MADVIGRTLTASSAQLDGASQLVEPEPQRADHQDDRNCAWALTAGLTALRDMLTDVIH